MLHVVYALCGDGRGHTSRALAVGHALRQRGHRVTFATGGAARTLLESRGEPVAPVPVLRQVMRGNRVRLLDTAWANLPLTWRSPEILDALAVDLRDLRADLVVSDHEPFVPRAARRVGLPVAALSHQLVLTETRCAVPLRFRANAWATARGVGLLAPPAPAATVVPSFFFPPLRPGSSATLVPPILREDVLAAKARPGNRVLVYVNAPEGLDAFLTTLGQVEAEFDVYGFPSDAPAPGNVVLRAPGRAAFLADLAAARAVVSTAGFTLLSEALHLGVPVLALPNQGFFEQTVNALYLQRLGRGEAWLEASLPRGALAAFLDRSPRYRRPPLSPAAGREGTEAAVRALSRVLAEPTAQPTSAPRSRWAANASAAA